MVTKGGTVLYHNQPNTLTTLSAQDKENHQRDVVNAFISKVLLGEGKKKKNSNQDDDGSGPSCREVLSMGTNQSNIIAEWLDGSSIASSSTTDDTNYHEEWKNWIVLAVYPEVAIRKLHGVDGLLSSLMKRYSLYYDHHCKLQCECDSQSPQQSSSSWNRQLFVPPSNEFDTAFHSIIRRFQDQLASSASSNSISSMDKRTTNKSSSKQQSNNQNNKKGKEKRVWHDGKQKITKAALAELDMSKDKDSTDEVGPDGIREDARAIAEAKAAYMPNANEKPAWEEEDEFLDDFDITWNTEKKNDKEEEEEGEEQASSGIRGFFSNLLSPNRPLTKSDLEPPLKQMQELLTSKNVAPSTAQAICGVVEKQLLGKKVGTLVGVKRAVRHALEDAMERILRPELGGIGGRGGVTTGKSVDLLRGVVEKRERGNSGGMFGMGGGAKGGRPYVIVMIGINGGFFYFF